MIAAHDAAGSGPFAKAGPATLRCRASGAHPLRVGVADGFWLRLRGLMFSAALPAGCGLLMTRCASVHTAFMRYAIDVAYLDAAGTVVKCVPALRPWRASWGLGAGRAAHVLELPAGSIARLGLAPGDWLSHAAFGPPAPAPVPARPAPMRGGRQRGAAMVEFIVIGPVMTLLGLGAVQYGMLFNAKNLINHASFMAARAGSFDHADLGKVREAYTRALLPMFGGGTDVQARARALALATADVGANVRIELLNPTRQSFADWNDPDLQAALNTAGKRVIPNANLAYRINDAATAQRLGSTASYKSYNGSLVKTASGQSLADANLIKLRITHGYEPKVPLMRMVYVRFLRWLDPGTDDFHTAMVESGRIPVVTNVTLHMESAAIEPDNPVSLPGEGNHGTPSDPGDPPVATGEPPRCATAGCSVEPSPNPADPGDPGDPGGCTGADCPVCTGG